MRAMLRALDRHWFAPASLGELALVRIVVVGAQLYFFMPRIRMQLWLAAADAETFVPIPALKVLLLPLGGWGVRPESMLLIAVWLLAVLAGLAAILGLHTRLSMLVFAATNTLLMAHSYSYLEYHHPEALMILALWVLALGPVGAAYSVDSLRDRLHASTRFMQFRPHSPEEDRSVFARWPLRVIQWLFVLVYLSAGLSKLAIGGLDWFNGYTMSYYLVADGLGRNNTLSLWLHEHLLLGSMMSIAGGVFELTFVLAILLPWLAGPYVLAGTMLHLGIYLTLRAPFFQFIVLYVVFVESLRQPLAVWLAARRTAAAPQWTVIYDGLCPLCIRSMVVLDTLDLRRRLHYVDLERDWHRAAALAPAVTPEQARHAMHVVGPDGRVYRGFFAFRELARVLPPLWPLLPLFHAPFAATVGPRVYSLVAENRGREVCRAETCAI
jgi:predicted DCC family thiol-disulfide oxidoreductase YuxK/uncharacterized membrane protein YphA (DoxX/SURF4 family)